MISSNICQKAWIFASRKHNGQLYPGADRLPYLTHIGAVLLELLPALQADHNLNADLTLCCAILHDIVEDTETEIEEIKNTFSEEIASGVLALTKTKGLKGIAAMRDSLDRILLQPQEIWIVKLADRSSNLQTPPNHWSKVKCISYADVATIILNTLGSASSYLSGVLHNRINLWKDGVK